MNKCLIDIMSFNLNLTAFIELRSELFIECNDFSFFSKSTK